MPAPQPLVSKPGKSPQASQPLPFRRRKYVASQRPHAADAPTDVAPAPHGSQSTARAPLRYPAGHAWHRVAAIATPLVFDVQPPTVAKRPAAQPEHAADAGAAATDPSRHGSQSPALPAYPGAQAVHAVVPFPPAAAAAA